MITAHKSYLARRCIERGWTLDEVMPCVIASNGDIWTWDERHPAYPRKEKAGFVKPRRGLGDMVKAGLSAIGITEERVSKAIGRPCGCGQRAEALNELGRKIGIG